MVHAGAVNAVSTESAPRPGHDQVPGGCGYTVGDELCMRVPGSRCGEQSRTEPMALYKSQSPWSPSCGAVRFVVDLPIVTRRTDPPDKRREVALLAIDELPPADVTIWSGGSAKAGTLNGGASALIQLHNLHREMEVRAPAGGVCSMLRAELVAIREALSAVAGLDAEERRQSRRTRLLANSKSGVQFFKQAPAAQTSTLATAIWRLIQELEDSDESLIFQWVPPGRQRGGRPVSRGGRDRGAQAQVPEDLASARGATRRRAMEMAHTRARAAHPVPTATPGHDELTRWEAVTVSQLCTGCSPLTRDALLRLQRDHCPLPLSSLR